MTINTLTATRRAILGAIPATAAIAAIPTIAFATDRSEWEAALSSWQNAKAEYEAFAPQYSDITARWLAGRPGMDTIHWREFPMANRHHVAYVLDLDEAWHDFCNGEGKIWSAANPAASTERYRNALDSVKAFREADEAYSRSSGMDAAEERSEELTTRLWQAEANLRNTPAPDLAALRWKLDYLLADDDSGNMTAWSMEQIAQTKADIARLTGDA